MAKDFNKNHIIVFLCFFLILIIFNQNNTIKPNSNKYGIIATLKADKNEKFDDVLDEHASTSTEMESLATEIKKPLATEDTKTISEKKLPTLKKVPVFMAKEPPKVVIDTPDYRVEGTLQNNKNYVIIGATMPRREKQIHYTWYIPVTARIWASKGYMPLVFLAGNFAEWENNILGRTARDAVREIPGAVLVYFTCPVDKEVTMAQVGRVMGVGNLIDVSNAEDSYFITTDIDLWPLNIHRHELPPGKQIVISRALSGLKGCCHISIALSCVGMKGKTWRAVTTFDDCNKETTNPIYYERYCTDKGVLVADRVGNGGYKPAAKIRTVSNTTDKILDYASQFLGDYVFTKNHGKGATSRDTWFVDQRLATILVRMWTERNIKPGQSARDTTQTYPKKVDRIDRGKGWGKLHAQDFNPDNYQDTHLPGGAQFERVYKTALIPFFKYLISDEEIEVITQYQKLFESRMPEWSKVYGENKD